MVKVVVAVMLLGIVGCGVPEQSGVRQAMALSREPSACGDGGGCPQGQACGDEGICGTICGLPSIPGDKVVCPLGYYCSHRLGGGSGYGYPWWDCLPLCYIKGDMGCP